MDDDNGGHAAFAAALSGAEPPLVEDIALSGDLPSGAPEPAPQDAAPAPAPSEPAPSSPVPSDPPAPAPTAEAMVPSWRLREITEAREAERQRFAEQQRAWEADRQRLAELDAQARQRADEERRAREAAALAGEDFFADPGANVDRRVEHRLAQITERYDQRFEQLQREANQRSLDLSRHHAEQRHGADIVTAAAQRVLQAIRDGDPEAVQFDRAFNGLRDPFTALMDFDRRREVLRETGGDLDAYRQRHADDLLRDPQFLQRALEAHRQAAVPVQTGAIPGRQPAPQPHGGMPSLNRTSGSAGDAGEVDDPNAVFREALATSGRR